MGGLKMQIEFGVDNVYPFLTKILFLKVVNNNYAYKKFDRSIYSQINYWKRRSNFTSKSGYFDLNVNRMAKKSERYVKQF